MATIVEQILEAARKALTEQSIQEGVSVRYIVGAVTYVDGHRPEFEVIDETIGQPVRVFDTRSEAQECADQMNMNTPCWCGVRDGSPHSRGTQGHYA